MIVSNNITDVQIGDLYSFDIYNPSKSFDVNILGKNKNCFFFRN